MPSPVAYIRRSVARAGDPGDVSRQFQTDKVRSLANGDGPTLQIIDGDWGRSAAGEKTDKRLAFLALLDSVERGEVSTLYAYSTDRLARSVRWAAQLLDACEAAGTTIVTSEGRFAPGDDMARQMFHFQAMQNEGALRQMATKSAAVATKRKERGDIMGRAPYGYKHAMIDGVSKLAPREGEDPQAVVAAFRQAGTYTAAAALLNGTVGKPVFFDGRLIGDTGFGLPTRFGKNWDGTVVKHVVKLAAPDLIPLTRHQGSPAAKSAHVFARLLRCPHADQHPKDPKTGEPTRLWLTVSTAPLYKGRQYRTTYYCGVARLVSESEHKRPYMVVESRVLAWAKEATKDIPRRMKVEQASNEPGPEAQIAELEGRKEAIGDAYAAGAYGPLGSPQAKAAMAQRLAAIDAEIPALEAKRRAVRSLGVGLQPDGSFRLPPFTPSGIDWNADPATINARLRELWHWVELDPATMEPVRAKWTFGNSPAEREAMGAAEAERETFLQDGHTQAEWLAFEGSRKA
jgi:DNA invertase Pin-like site-specific DNA recombinase